MNLFNRPVTPPVPIVGQPYNIHDFTITLAVTHNCGEGQPLSLSLGSTKVCSGCRKPITFGGVQPQANGQLGFALAVGNTPVGEKPPSTLVT